MLADAPGGSASRARLLCEAAFWGPLILATILIALWPPHTVDGPAHVLGAHILGADGPELTEVYSAYYDQDLTPSPNLGGNLLLMVLEGAAGDRGGETLMLILCAVALPIALRFAVHAIRPQQSWAAVAALPFGFGYLFFYGFYGFCLGLALFLLSVGLALRPASRRPLLLMLALTATWFTHLVPFALAVGVVGLIALAADRRPVALARAALPMLPGLALTVYYSARTSQGDNPEWLNPVGLVVGLVGLHSPLVALSKAENIVAAVLAVLLVVVAVRMRPVELPGEHGAAVRGIGWATAAATLLYLVAPNNLGIDFGLINERLSLFPPLLLLLWLLIRPMPARVTAILAAGSVAAAGALLAVRAPELRRIDRLADEYATAQQWVTPGSTLVALRFVDLTPDAGRNSNADPIRHLSSLLAARTGSLDVGHYEAVFDYFPARFDPDKDPRRAIDPDLGGLPQVPPRVDLDGATGVFARPIDVVLLVGAWAARTPATQQALAETRERLQKNYERVGVTTPTGLVEVWRSRASG